MDSKKKWTYFQLLRDKTCVSTLVFLSLVLAPAQPPKVGSSHWIEVADNTKKKEVSELFKIYSVVKTHRTDLKDASVWAISRTILEESRKHFLDPLLVLAVIRVESSFQELAVSSEGARGLMQIRPIVASTMAKEVDLSSGETPDPDSLDDPIHNIKLGVFYLRHLKKSFRDLKLALTAYNWGPTEIRNRLEENEEVPLEYATKVLAAYHGYRKGRGQTH